MRPESEKYLISHRVCAKNDAKGLRPVALVCAEESYAVGPRPLNSPESSLLYFSFRDAPTVMSFGESSGLQAGHFCTQTLPLRSHAAVWLLGVLLLKDARPNLKQTPSRPERSYLAVKPVYTLSTGGDSPNLHAAPPIGTNAPPCHQAFELSTDYEPL